MSENTRGVRAKLTTYKTVLYGMGIVLAGFGAMWLSNVGWFTKHAALQATTNQLGGLLITVGGLAILWDLRGKRDIMEEVLEKVRIESDVSAAGIERVTMKYLDDIQWDELFRNARHLAVFIAYGSSWRKVHWTKLQAFAEREGNRLQCSCQTPMTSRRWQDSLSASTIRSKRFAMPFEIRRKNLQS